LEAGEETLSGAAESFCIADAYDRTDEMLDHFRYKFVKP